MLFFNKCSSSKLTLPLRGYRFCGWEGRNQRQSELRPHVAKSYFETYQSQNYMQIFRFLSWKLSEISRFQNLVKIRFCATLLYKNCHNSLNLFLFFCVLKIMFCNLDSTTNLNIFNLLVPPSEGVWGNFFFKFKVSNQQIIHLGVITISARGGLPNHDFEYGVIVKISKSQVLRRCPSQFGGGAGNL